MHEEKEVKFLHIDPVALQAKLTALGAEKVGEYFYRRRVFDYPDMRLNKANAWVRVRDEGEKIMLCYKQRQGVTSQDGTTSDTGMEEVEVEVKDFDKTCLILERVGLVEK